MLAFGTASSCLRFLICVGRSADDTLLCLQASYALGYNLAIEYLADYEKTWMLDSFRAFDAGVLAPQGRRLREWLFLEARVCSSSCAQVAAAQ